MKIRIMGTMDECTLAVLYYKALEKQKNIKYVQVSELYPNRGSSKLFRLYVDIGYRSEETEIQRLLKGKK